METRFGFTKYTIGEFEQWFAATSIARNINHVQEHHTWRPTYAEFNGSNHFSMQRAMKNHHVSNNGWSDIGQHFSIFPDGAVVSGRPLNKAPACIFGANAGGICFESVGDFDSGRDAMTAAQRESILRSCAAVLRRFPSIRRDEFGIVYHHWFNLETGVRNNGSGNNKSCPGTGYFGGNKVASFRTGFAPAVLAGLGGGPVPQADSTGRRYVVVTADFLNIRVAPGSSNPLVSGPNRAELGSVLRVWGERDGWLKVSGRNEHWVSGRHTADVRRGLVNTDGTNCRLGPGTDFEIARIHQNGDEVFVETERDGWLRVGADRWIKATLVTLDA